MKNTYKLIWSEEALNGLKDIISYIENKFSEKDVRKFIKKLDKQLTILEVSPTAFPLSDKSYKIRRMVVAKLTSIYYLIDNEFVKLVSIFDNRMNPKKISKR